MIKVIEYIRKLPKALIAFDWWKKISIENQQARKGNAVKSYDIFDTCLVRKCGTPQNFFDVLSLRVFRDTPTENERQEFICHRIKSEYSSSCEGITTLQKIYDKFQYFNPKLMSKEELYQCELQCEQDMLISAYCISDEIKQIHEKGDKVIFISDMYLPESFLRDILVKYEMYMEGDSIYVSCDVGKTKLSGELFAYVMKVEKLNFVNWTHRGDNLQADKLAPKKLGINTSIVSHDYSYYQQIWKNTDCGLQFKVKSIAAGLSRSVRVSNRLNSHSTFVTDIIAPFYTSWTYKILSDAKSKGIVRLYFCARDGYQQYKIAKILQERLFPDVECRYLYISRQALTQEDKNSTLKYFIQEGLASQEQVAIVDTRSQGRTQYVINDLLSNNGYQEVFGYYFEIFPCGEIKYNIRYRAEVNKIYVSMNRNIHDMLKFEYEGPLYEIFFAMNSMPRTIGYEENKNTKSIEPVFCYQYDDYYVEHAQYWMDIHSKLLTEYAYGYVQTGLYNYSELLFSDIAINTLNDFFDNPTKEYVIALNGFRCQSGMPFVDNSGIFKYIKTRGRNSMWKAGSRAFFMSERQYRKLKHIIRICFYFIQ